MIRLLFVFVFIFLLACTHTDKTYQPNIAETKSFFAQVDDSILTKRSFLLVDIVRKEWKDLFVRTASYQKVLRNEDIQFIAEQFDNTSLNVWTNVFFDSARIVSEAYIHNFQKNIGSTPVHYKFSMLYFSKDKKYCILYYDHYCGNLCAEQSLILYKQENGRWVIIKTLFSVVS
jgi:hypothetical protein